MNEILTADQINAAYGEHREAHAALADATTVETNARTALENQKAYLLASGIIDGKNADTREAQAREHLTDLHAALAEAQARVAYQRTVLTLSGLEIERCKTLIKYLEVAESETWTYTR